MMQCSGRDATRALAAWRDEANFSQRLQRGPDGGARAHHARRFLVNALAAGCSCNCIANTAKDHPQPQVSSQTVLHIYHYVCKRHAGFRASKFKVTLQSLLQGLSASQQYFSLTTNQHRPGLSAQKPTNERDDYIKKVISSSDQPISQSSHAFCAKKFSDLVRIAGSELF